VGEVRASTREDGALPVNKLHCDYCDAVVDSVVSPHYHVPMAGAANGRDMGFTVKLSSSGLDVCRECFKAALSGATFLNDAPPEIR
jgi:hypothetical protein